MWLPGTTTKRKVVVHIFRCSYLLDVGRYDGRGMFLSLSISRVLHSVPSSYDHRRCC